MCASKQPEDPEPSGLTDRQKQVTDLVLRGMTNREIGSMLLISEATVKRHLYEVYTSLGVKNRVQLVRRLLGYADGAERGEGST